MTLRRALVVGSALDGMIAPTNDVRAMTKMLVGRGFVVESTANATHDDILDGYDRLIDASKPGDAAVVYYSGHGFMGKIAGRSWQCIAPMDVYEGSDTDWRGITDRELSIKQRQLTERTHNVTVILDCCSAAQMSRDAAVRGATVRALPHPIRLGLNTHLAALREKYRDYRAYLDDDPIGNEHAVRFVACGQGGQAYESPDDRDVVHGFFTSNLISVLESIADTPISWNVLAEIVRARVMSRYSSQRPAIEGPGRRRLFELDIDADATVVSITSSGGSYLVRSGLLAGDRAGDIYAVLRPDAITHQSDRELARLEIVAVHPLVSQARHASGATTFHDGAIAVPILRNAPRHPVRLDVPAAVREVTAKAIADARTLRVAGEADTEALATLKVENDQVTIEDAWGPLFPPSAFPDDLAVEVNSLVGLGVAMSLRALDGEHGVRAQEVEIELGVVVNGKPVALPDAGASLGLGDRLYVQVKNTSSRRLYAHIFNIGLRGRVKLVTGDIDGMGARVDPGETFVLGARDNALSGIPLEWPAGLPRESFPRKDEIAVFVTTTPVNLRNLETQQVRTTQRAAGTPLGALLGQLHDGCTRGGEPVEAFFLKLLSYALYPQDSTLQALAFELDDNPTGLSAARDANAWRRAITPKAEPVRIVIAELALLEPRDLAHVRVDALVCTRSVTGGQVTWTGMVPLMNSVVFTGDVHDFVDINVFVSRDATMHPSLAELLAARDELGDAMRALRLDSQSPWTPAIAASATLARIAYERLRVATGTTVGLYRTSFLASERFGIGRHPHTSRYCAQDLSLALVVAPGPAGLA